jgi:hypothetical protein
MDASTSTTLTVPPREAASRTGCSVTVTSTRSVPSAAMAPGGSSTRLRVTMRARTSNDSWAYLEQALA